MSTRASRPNTPADDELAACLNSVPPRSFTMIAGAGSGKTTSLIKALTTIVSSHGDRLMRQRQQVACITYTEIAAGEIWADVGNHPLVRVSTIHSFLWSVIKSFQGDIREWVKQRIDTKLDDLRTEAVGFGPRVQQKTRDKNQRDIARYEEQRGQIDQVRSFTYGTGADYPKGILGHDDIIKMVPALLMERPLLRRLVAQQFPFVFVDESQDTFDVVVEALKAIDHQMGDAFCLGFFGDPMQQIYATGIGGIPLEDGWADIKKPENFRCPASVLNVANAIRRDGDGLVQTRGQMTVEDGVEVTVQGTANIYIYPTGEQREAHVAAVRAQTALTTNDPAWGVNAPPDAVKVLVIVHRMAARRLGFGDLYAALNDQAPDSFKNGFLDATAWPVRPFLAFVLPLVDAARHGREFEVMQVLRSQSPMLAKEGLAGGEVAARLARLRVLTEELGQLLAEGSAATNRQVLTLLRDSGIFALDPRILPYLEGAPAAADVDGAADEEGPGKEIAAMERFLACPAAQFWGYWQYVQEQSPFSTQQGIKGAEFPRVLVVLDDDEGTHTQFSYDKYFGLKPLSDRDLKNIAEGRETAVERTRRLFYVCCTRALKDLAVVWFTSDTAAAEARLRQLALFDDAAIHRMG